MPLLRWWMVPVGGAILAVALALLLAHEAGFPLDDAWIHQDFARTLATTGRFALQPGRSGAGSTSPVWVVLLVLPNVATHGSPPLWFLVGWDALLGTAILGGLGVVTGMAAGDVARTSGGTERVALWAAVLAGLAAVWEWHLVWASISGMETDLFALLALALVLAASRGVGPLWLGTLAAVTIAVRPEGVLAAALVVAGSAWVAFGAGLVAPPAHARERRAALGRLGEWAGSWLAPFGVGLLAGLVPYVTLNVVASGNVFPSTLYAKASYYGASNVVQGVASYATQVGIVMVGSSPILLTLAGLSCSQWLLARRERRAHSTDTARNQPRARGSVSLQVLLWLWPGALVLGYAGHLTELVHHGRYLMPAIPPVLALCGAGAAPLLWDRRYQLWSLVGGVALSVTGLLSLGRGAQIYADNVHFIDACQVTTAHWLRASTPAGALVATHDVGAIAYFSGRPVLDMAGLVDPQVIPLLHDQTALSAYLARHHAAYVVMFVDWFPPPATLAHELAGRDVHHYHPPGAADFVVYRTGW